MSVLFTLEHAVARCLWVTDDHVYVGTNHERGKHQLVILDRRGEVIKTWPTPYLVSGVAVAGEQCFAALGPGVLMTWNHRGLRGKPTRAQVDPNAPKLVVHADALWWGTAHGEIHRLDGGLVARVRKWLTSIAVDTDRVYAGYADGKLRAFSHSGKKLAPLDVGTRAVRCALAERALVAADAMSGLTTIFDRETLAPKTTFTCAADGPYGIIQLAVFDEMIVTRTRAAIELHDLAGTRRGAWRAPDGELIEDAWLTADALLVASGRHVHRIARRSLARSR